MGEMSQSVFKLGPYSLYSFGVVRSCQLAAL